MSEEKLFTKKKQKIMVVDDELDIASIVGERLGESGFDINVQWDPREAIKILKNESFDLVVTDLKMPYIDGFQLMGWMKDNCPLTKVVVITAHGSPSAYRAALKRGAVLYIEKPFDLDEFATKIENILEPPKEFEAKIESISPFDLIQMMALAGGNRRLSVKSLKGSGEMYIRNGKLVYARSGNEFMDKAFYRMLSWQSGVFNVAPWTEPPEEKPTMDVNMLLIEAARRIDEGLPLVQDEKEQLRIREKLFKTPPEEIALYAQEEVGTPEDSEILSVQEISKIKGIDAVLRVDSKWKLINSSKMNNPQSIVKAAFFLNEWGCKVGEKFGLSRPDEVLLYVQGRELWIRAVPWKYDVYILSANVTHREIVKKLGL
ncbi:MAG: response regulator [bacterium]